MRRFLRTCALLAMLSLSVPVAAQTPQPSATASPTPTASPTVGSTASPTADPSPTASATPAPLRYSRLAGADRIATAIAIARSSFTTAEMVVLVGVDSYAEALIAAPYAARHNAPVLLTPVDAVPDAVVTLIEEFAATRIVVLGGEGAVSEEALAPLRRGRRVSRVAGADRYATAARLAAKLPASNELYLAGGTAYPDGLALGPLAARSGHAILLTLPDRLPEITAEQLHAHNPHTVTIVGGEQAVGRAVVARLQAEGRTVRRLSGSSRHGTSVAIAEAIAGLQQASRRTVWLADGAAYADALAAGAAAARRGAVLLLVDGQSLSAALPVSEWLREHKAVLREVVFLGGRAVIAADAAEQVQALLDGKLLPRGGRSLLPEFRLVALYGHSSTAALGSLGEQSPEKAAERAVRVAEPFAVGDRPVMPTFEFIATIATANPGASGLYRARTDQAVLQRSLDAIRKVNGYLVLDIQPGRSDFFTEAKHYEALLMQPDVGLALDPEWRMGPNEKPGQRVGSVHASEINKVSAWLAELVARNALPEKLLLLHQFQDQMIRDRHLLQAHEGLAIAVQMDGFGSRAQKLATYSRTRIAPPFFNGFKLFYDEDSNIYQPHEALKLDPVPDFVSYQ